METKQRRSSVAYLIAVMIALFLIQSVLFAPHPPAWKVCRPRRRSRSSSGTATERIASSPPASTIPTSSTELEAAHVRFTGHAENAWLSILMSWVLPAVIFFGLWSFLIRRMGPQGGLMSIGKSKARVYVEHATGATFKDVAGIDEARAELVEIVEHPDDRYQRPRGRSTRRLRDRLSSTGTSGDP